MCGYKLTLKIQVSLAIRHGCVPVEFGVHEYQNHLDSLKLG